jgi:hypothetical protein
MDGENGASGRTWPREIKALSLRYPFVSIA